MTVEKTAQRWDSAMNEENDEQIDTYIAAKIADAVEIFCRLEEAMRDLRHSAYMGQESIWIAHAAATVRRQARKLIDELQRMDMHCREKQEKAKQLKIIK